ncbi:putative fatty acyl-CoA reductase CG5065, partial [Nylanderia fulva]|uniref:putative fatty acyl-CoA reductase CG5065 n=1 Tax=Nylanderia fulva TaxID=613905 RepID=UPI0010FB64D1
MDKNNAAKSISAFYAGLSILLTGVTSFLGKIYFEKLLRSCPDLYDKLRQEQSSNFKKLIPISGDTSQENLGLSAVDRQMLIKRVNIIIHAAASVIFNDILKYAILTNTRSMRDICILAE